MQRLVSSFIPSSSVVALAQVRNSSRVQLPRLVRSGAWTRSSAPAHAAAARGPSLPAAGSGRGAVLGRRLHGRGGLVLRPHHPPGMLPATNQGEERRGSRVSSRHFCSCMCSLNGGCSTLARFLCPNHKFDLMPHPSK